MLRQCTFQTRKVVVFFTGLQKSLWSHQCSRIIHKCSIFLKSCANRWDSHKSLTNFNWHLHRHSEDVTSITLQCFHFRNFHCFQLSNPPKFTTTVFIILLLTFYWRHDVTTSSYFRISLHFRLTKVYKFSMLLAHCHGATKAKPSQACSKIVRPLYRICNRS